MHIHRQKREQLILLYQKYLLYLCLIVLSLIIFYILFGRQYFLILQPIEIPIVKIESSDGNIHSTSGYIRKENNISRSDLSVAQPLFQSFTPSYYPQLPIHIFTQNLTSLKNITKLILLGNEFFGDKKWGLNAIGKSSTELMTQLSCPFLSNYCGITTDKKLFSQADAVVYHMRDDINQRQAKKYRQPNQRFVFTLWESPIYTPDLTSYNEFFNWTMTYRFKSHIITSYYFSNGYLHTSNNYYHLMRKDIEAKKGHLNIKKPDHQLSDEILAKKKLGTAAALISNCGGASKRLRFIKRLKGYIDIHVYGRCGKTCPANINCREFLAENYYFFLSFENSLCIDYTTEKFFSVLEYPIVPVVYGRTNYSSFIPSSGFIDTNDFTNLTSLAQYLNQTRDNKEKYLSYFSWKKDYVWGMTQMFTPFCDLCLRLHLDSTPNVIHNMDAWWNEKACAGTNVDGRNWGGSKSFWKIFKTFL